MKKPLTLSNAWLKIVSVLFFLIFSINDAKAASPSVTITSPGTGTSFVAGSIIMVSATTANFTHSISNVKYTVTGAATYTFTQSALDATNSAYNGYFNTSSWAVGTYTISVVATDSHGATNTPKTITVNITAAPAAPAAINVTTGKYGFSKAIILNTSAISVNSSGISSILTNFPALIYIKDDALKTGNVCGDKVQFPRGDGGGLTAGTNYDFAFTLSGNNTELNYQVDTYDSINGILFAWVQIPTLTSTNVPLTFYFGSQSPAHSAATEAATWATDYQVVYHFNEASTSATVLDATSNARNATQAHTSVTNDEIHIAANVPIPGGGYSFDGSTSNIIQTSGTNPNIVGNFTLSAWVLYNGGSNSDNKIISDELNYGHGYKLSVKQNASGVENIESETRTAANPVPGNLLNTGAVASSQWVYIVGEFDGTNFINYTNGTAATTTVAGAPPEPGDVISLGIDYLAKTGTNQATNYYNGYMDEVRISNVAKSADWIRAEYYNQTQPLTFTNYSAPVISYATNAATLTPGALIYTWTGATSADPTVATNWDISTAPDFSTGKMSLVVPAVATNKYPQLKASGSVYALTIANGASLNLGGFTLNVGCNIYNNATTGGTGILNASNSASGINWNGSIAAQTYTGTNNPTTAEIGIMSVNNSSAATITINGGPIDIFNQLTLTKGNLVINNATNGALTLKSTSTLTASVTAIPSSYSVTGNVKVERYISGGSNTYRGYRLLSSPIYTAKVGSNYYFDLSYLPQFAPITGTLGTTGGLSKVGNPSMYLYRDNVAFTNATFNTGNFRGINTINNTPLYSIGIDYDGNFNLHPGTGVLFFYRGTLANISTKYTPSTSAEPGLFVSTGVLNQQSVTVTNWYTGSTTLQVSVVPGNTGYSGYNLVGNPYASSIDWLTFSSSSPGAGIYGPGVGKTIYILNETTKIYATYDQSLGINGGSNIIPSGQGFFIKASTSTTSTPQLIFNESAKTNTQVTGPTQATGPTLLLSVKPVATPELQYLRLELDADTINKEETIIRFDSQAKNEYVLNEDSQHFTGAGIISLSSMSSDNVQMAINDIPLPKQTQKIKLNVNTTADGLFKLNMTEVKAIPEIYEVWLMDNYKKDSLDMRHNSTYSFNVLRSDTNSYGSNRFSLVIRQDPALGVHLLNFAATKSTDGSLLTWKTENEENYTNFTVERSTDYGKTFDVLGGFSSNDQGTYSFTDKKPPVAADEYRLKIEDLNDSTSYSKIITLLYGNLADNKTNNLINVYPNPAASNINLSIVQNANGTQGSDNVMYNIMIMSSNGTVVKAVDSSQNTWQGNVSNLLPGTYIVQVINNNDKSLVGKTKFVKL